MRWIAILLSIALNAHAQTGDELLNLAKEGTAQADSAVAAAREIQSQLIAETARAQAIEILGEKRYLKNKSAVETKIVRQAAKFIPFVNPGTPVQQPDGTWKMALEIKLSPASLRKMIADAGLLNDAEGPALIVPVVTIADSQKGVSLRWWQGEPKDEAHKFVSEISRLFHDKMQAEFSKQGFHIIKPQGSQISPLPEQYRAQKPSGSDHAFITDYYRATLALKGDLRFRQSKEVPGVALIAIRLQVVHASSGRSVAEISRQLTTESGPYESVVRSKLQAEIPDVAKDLAVQVLEAWQRGTLNTNSIRLAVRGNLNPKQLSDFKAGLMQNVHDVKGVKERLFDRGTVLFEVDYTGEPGPLLEQLKGLKLSSLDTKVSEASEKQVSLDVRVR